MQTILLGKKIGMTQVYNEQNELVPVTVIQAGPCPITQVKTTETDGYQSVQIAFDEAKENRVTSPVKGHLAKSGTGPMRVLKEFRVSDERKDDFKVGETISVANFKEGQKVDIIATTKGRGFQGVMKRWGFHGQPASHGHMMHRRPGSIGQCQWPGEVDKGKKMPGHMGVKQRTTQNLKIVKVLEDKNVILVAGSFAGNKGSDVIVRETKKVKKQKQA